jgi:hypothetical protein
METAFWAIEVYESNLLEDGIEILESVWIQVIGFGSWFLLKLILFIYEQGEISEQEWTDICCAFARHRIRDSTIFHLLLRGAITHTSPVFSHSKEYTTIQEAVLDCLQRGKLKEAWLLGRSLEPSEQWTMLESLGYNQELSIIKEFRQSMTECLAIAYVLVSLDPICLLSSQADVENKIPDEVMDAIEEWSLEQSMRKRRVFKPRSEALLYLTERSEQSPYTSSEPEIQLDLEETLKSSEFWSEIMTPYIKEGSWVSDRKKEKFYDTFFPHDIPDEWSSADREKSHGHGLGKTKEQARQRFIYHILQRSRSLELWDSAFPQNIDCSMEWDSLYSKKPLIELPMKPIRKVFEPYIDLQSCQQMNHQ